MQSSVLSLPTNADVMAARGNIHGFVLRTPLVRLAADREGTQIYLKLENLQPLGSFKIRPALNALKTMDRERLRGGVLTASAGNFGQGLAFAAREIGVPATVVVPEGSAATKAQALAELGAKVIRLPFDEWWTVLLTSRGVAGETGAFIHPVAESAVIVRQCHHRRWRSSRICRTATPSWCPSAAAVSRAASGRSCGASSRR